MGNLPSTKELGHPRLWKAASIASTISSILPFYIIFSSLLSGQKIPGLGEGESTGKAAGKIIVESLFIFILSALGGLIAYDEVLMDCTDTKTCQKKDEKGQLVDRKQLVLKSAGITATISFAVFLLVRIIITFVAKEQIELQGAGGNAIVWAVMAIIMLFVYVFYAAGMVNVCFNSCDGANVKK